jgi:hypothetical protein
MACQLSIDTPLGARALKELCTRERVKRETGIEIPDITGNHVHISQALIQYSGTSIARLLGYPRHIA